MTKPRKPLNLELQSKPKGVTAQMKALSEYFLLVVFTLLLNRLHVFANFIFNLDRETCQGKRLIVKHSPFRVWVGKLGAATI